MRFWLALLLGRRGFFTATVHDNSFPDWWPLAHHVNTYGLVSVPMPVGNACQTAKRFGGLVIPYQKTGRKNYTMSDTTNSLMHVKVGDTLVSGEGVGNFRVHQVERLTETLIVTHDGSRFRRRDGLQQGRYKFDQRYARPATPELLAEVAKQHAIEWARSRASSELRRLSPERVNVVRDVVHGMLGGQEPGLPVSQEPKYSVNAFAIINRATSQAIPHDEPVFIFRARDVHATYGLKAYASRCGETAHALAVGERIEAFEQFAKNNPDRMKTPDTAGYPQ